MPNCYTSDEINHPGLAEIPAPDGFQEVMSKVWVFPNLTIAGCRMGPLHTLGDTLVDTLGAGISANPG